MQPIKWLICTSSTPTAAQCSKNPSQNQYVESVCKLKSVYKFKTQEQTASAQNVLFFHPTWCVTHKKDDCSDQMLYKWSMKISGL